MTERFLILGHRGSPKRFPENTISSFDEALRDPKDPVRLRVDYHCGDWIHPSDAGYTKMAETAAAVLKKP
mgnify:CR=1 FL=1